MNVFIRMLYLRSWSQLLILMSSYLEVHAHVYWFVLVCVNIIQ